jgi:hypothetical protein
MIFVMVLNTHSDYFSEQHKFAVFVMEKECGLCSVITDL